MDTVEESCKDDEREAEIRLDSRYSFPDRISIQKYAESYLAIFTEGVAWLVLENDSQLNAFRMLQDGSTVGEVLDVFDESDVANVIMQIEAKQFYNPPIGTRRERSMYALLTNRCNQRCRHCFMYAGDIDYEELSANQWINILDNFKKYGGTGVTFTGGEVTVYDGYDRIIKHAHNLGLSVTVLTNGMLWTQDVVDELHFAIDEVQVSVDGFDTLSYYSVRQYDGFEKALDCIGRFSRTDTKVSMAVTPLQSDLDVFVEGFELFARGFLAEYPDVFIKLNLELLQGREVSVTSKENKEYRKKLGCLIEALYPNYYTETFVLNYEDRSIRQNCGFGEISIAANGDVYWCNRIPELSPAANVLKDDFAEIMLLSEKVKEDTSVDNTTVCKDCDIRYICGGGCRLEYEGIREADSHVGEWKFLCRGKGDIYKKMVFSNEYFFM